MHRLMDDIASAHVLSSAQSHRLRMSIVIADVKAAATSRHSSVGVGGSGMTRIPGGGAPVHHRNAQPFDRRTKVWLQCGSAAASMARLVPSY